MLPIVSGISAGATLLGSLLFAGKIKRRKFATQSGGLACALSLPRESRPAVADRPIGESEREVNHYLLVSCGSLGLATLGALLYPPLSLLSAAGSFYTCVPIFVQAYRGLVKQRRLRSPIIDSIGVTTALIAGFYFASALACVLYFTSRKLLLKTEDNSLQNLTSVFGEQPRSAWVVQEGVEMEVPVESLRLGDIVVLGAGEMVPVDGIISEGFASIDQHMLTGESQAAEKTVGDTVLAATVVLRGRILVKVAKTGEETIAAQIVEILKSTADYRMLIESEGERIADRSVLPILGAGSLALATQGLGSSAAVFNSNFSENMRIAAPLGMLNFLNLASRQGILIKDGRALGLIDEVDTVVFDKTGTLTLDQPHVGGIYCCNDSMDEDLLLSYAAAAESRQSHPIARAIRQAAADRQLPRLGSEDAHYELGYGIEAEIDGRMVLVGSLRFMAMHAVEMPEVIAAQTSQGQKQGYSFVYVAVDGDLAGIIELRPTLRPEAKAVIQALKTRGLSLYIISGDADEPTRALAENLGIEHYFAEVLPEDKAVLVRQLQNQRRKVCFIGDGINDAIALKQANASISLRGATTVATDTAQVILLDGSLNQLDFLFELTRDFKINMKTTTATTIIPSVFCIGGIFLFHFGINTAILMYNLSLIAGVGNAMLPVLRWGKAKQRLPGADSEQEPVTALEARHVRPCSIHPPAESSHG